MAERIVVDVVYAATDRVVRRRVELIAGSTVGQAIEASAIRTELSGWPIDSALLGIHARRVGLDELLHDGDRVEIYRPLALDPKEVRRRRADRG